MAGTVKSLISVVVLLATSLPSYSATRYSNRQGYKPFTIEDLLTVKRVGDPQISPDGKWVAYTISETDRAGNKRNTQIYLVGIQGETARQLTSGPASCSSPRWSPDGTHIAFVSARDGSPQVWTIEVNTGALKKITDVSTGAGGPIWSPDGRWIAFTSDIYPECSSEDCNSARAKQADESKVKARIATRLLYRHWTEWKEGKRAHILVVPSSGGTWRDLTPGDYDAPPFSLGGPDDYAFSPDSKELAFDRNTDPVEAISTNGDIFVVPVTGGEPKRLTGANHGDDLSPQYSPDGRYIAYRSQSTPGFESDRWQLKLYDRKTGAIRSVTEKLDSWVGAFVFSPDGKKIYLVADKEGRQPIYWVDVDGGPVNELLGYGFSDDLKCTPNGNDLVITRQSMTSPIELYRCSTNGGGLTQLTKTNDGLIGGFHMLPPEELVWDGAEGARVHGWLVKPANFTPDKKWPLLVLIHGGPQGAWEDAWSYRWNPEVFAAEGYVVFTPNPRGSTGYGQKFVDEISGDWGGKVFTDIMNGVDYAAKLPYIDRNRIGAAGASYGGYMIDWIEGHNSDPRFQFKVLVSHDGVYNLTSEYGSTEELWFPEWEFKGTPWTNPEMYARWSPDHFVKNFKTPMLVVHSDLDYRVPITEGLQLFTALQRQGVESKLLSFPDEGHFVLKPLNSELWYNTVLGWLDAHLKPKSETATEPREGEHAGSAGPRGGE
ncbi:MAG TPA: S9 family peptidase [Blastocatellia bacterium]|nr:S9 family peptidase [Blastocatellia bacterium]